MLHIDDTFEDTRIMADWFNGQEKWKGVIMDGLTGKTATFSGWSEGQMAAVMALAHGLGEDCGLVLQEGVVSALYSIAEPLFVENEITGMCAETRLIP